MQSTIKRFFESHRKDFDSALKQLLINKGIYDLCLNDGNARVKAVIWGHINVHRRLYKDSWEFRARGSKNE